MRIGIDARFYGTLGKGLGRYTSELISHLEEIDAENDYVVFVRRANSDEYVPKRPNFRKAVAEFPWYSLAEQLRYPRWLAKFDLDLMHFPHFNVPLLYQGPFVVTIHDLILLKHPTPRATTLGPLLYRLKYAAYRSVIRSALARASRIITVSHCTKNEIEKTFPFTIKKDIAVTYEACGTPFRAKSEERKGKSELPKPYALYVGNAYPHKNLERLIDAFALFRKTRPDFHLVLVGEKDYFYERLEREAVAKGLAENVVFFGKASDEELSAVYDGASFYVFPSLCEGFGLPPLEAMCRKVPVASSNASCMPEILGDAAFTFEPTKTEAIAEAMRTVASDDELRRRLVDAGIARAARYDWRRCAESTIEVYRKALKA